MAGSAVGPSGASRVDSGGGRLPNWMLRDGELDQTIVLQMRRKLDDTDNTQSNTQSSSNGQTKQRPIPLANPFIIGTTIELAIGVNEAKKVWATKEAQGSRYLLRTTSKTAIEKLCKITKLTNGVDFEVVLHHTLNTTQGIVYEPDCIDIDESSMLGFLEMQGVKSVRRITKRLDNVIKNTPLIVLTFHGTILPENVLFGRLRVPVRVYYPSPRVCFNCGGYGHLSKFCKQPGICLICSQPHHVEKGMKCNNVPHCKHCQGDHPSTSRSCSKYKDEVNIIRMQIDQKISSTEARKIYYEKNKKETMASMIQNRLNQNEIEKKKYL